jgi:peptide/nickel transport system permease protein
MKNSSLNTDQYQNPRLLKTRALQSVPVIVLAPFAMVLFRVFESHSIRIGAALLLCLLVSGAMIYAAVKTGKYKLIAGMLLILPMYFCMCVAFTDFPYFASKTVMTSFTKSLAPNSEFLLGTDYEGRDILSTIVIGGMNAYLVAAFATVIALFTGVPIGLLLSKNNRIVRQLASVVTQFFEIVPQLFFVLIVLGVFNFWAAASASTRLVASYAVPMAGFAIGLSSLPAMARVVENRVNQLKSKRFVTALQSSNVGSGKVLFYNILWKNSLSEIIVQATFLFGATILVESALGYAFEIGFGELGTGGYLSWGKILAEARRSILFVENLWIISSPILVTIMSILGVNIIGDTLAGILRGES